MQPINVIGALFFGALAAVTGAFGFINLFTVQQTVFGPARVPTTLPTLQLILALILLVVAFVSVRACVNQCKRCVEDSKRES